jgi:hypothetical protein
VLKSRIVVLPGVLTAILVLGCGSTSPSSTSATTSSATGPTTTRAANLKETLPGTKGHTKVNKARLRLRRGGPRAHLNGYGGESLPQKLEAMAADVAGVWSQSGLPPATVNVIDQTPVVCQSPQGAIQVSTTDAPRYCLTDATIDLPVATFSSKIEPIGDAAVLLVVADLYGYHVLNAVGALSPSSGLTAAQVVERDSCLGGLYFGLIQNQPNQKLTAADTEAVNKQILAIAAPGTAASANGVTAQDLTDAFNKGAFARANASACLK